MARLFLENHCCFQILVSHFDLGSCHARSAR